MVVGLALFGRFWPRLTSSISALFLKFFPFFFAQIVLLSPEPGAGRMNDGLIAWHFRSLHY